MKADLHSHTIYSDGIYSVYDTVLLAKEKGLSLVAITDHDNLDSYSEYLKIKDSLDIDVLIGIELSTWYQNENIHILGYFYNNSGPGEELLMFLYDMKLRRVNRAKKMIDNLNKYFNLNLNYEEIAALSKDIIARPHIARYISKKYNMDLKEVFTKYLSNESKAFVPTTNMSTKEAIDLLHRNNAIAVWAHPVLNKGKIHEIDIINMGIDGIEGVYPNNTKDDTVYYREISNKYNLLFTGGSDFHDHISHGDMGDCYIEDNDINKLLKKLKLK